MGAKSENIFEDFQLAHLNKDLKKTIIKALKVASLLKIFKHLY